MISEYLEILQYSQQELGSGGGGFGGGFNGTPL